jgi:hypothetical protein
MWEALEKPSLGFMNLFSESIASLERENPGSLPDLTHCRTIIAVSDYGGYHKTSQFESYSLLVACGDSWAEWEDARQRLRQAFGIGKRRLAFSKMSDIRKRRALTPFLATAEALHGLLVTVLVDKAIESLFVARGRLDRASSSRFAPGVSYTEGTFERLMRTVHLVSFFIAGLSTAGQNVIWLTDEDEIAANRQRLIGLSSIFTHILNHYLRHGLGESRCGTTESDIGSLQIEDLAAIPDLVAGALAETLTAYYQEGGVPSSTLLHLPPQNLSGKTRDIVRWLALESHNLKRLVYVIQGQAESTALILKRLRFQSEPLSVN